MCLRYSVYTLYSVVLFAWIFPFRKPNVIGTINVLKLAAPHCIPVNYVSSINVADYTGYVNYFMNMEQIIIKYNYKAMGNLPYQK